MHPYAIDSGERRLVPFFLAVLGILAALGLSKGLTWLSLSVPWWLDAPATMGFYSVFYGVFDRWLWRLPALALMRIVRTPLLDGRWRGEIVSSYDDRQAKQPVNVLIIQSWTKIGITLETEQSRSSSTIGGITDGADGPLLTYDYVNEPRGSAIHTMHMHRGVAHLRLRDQGTLEGDYFSGRGRETQGAIRLERVSAARHRK